MPVERAPAGKKCPLCGNYTLHRGSDGKWFCVYTALVPCVKGITKEEAQARIEAYVKSMGLRKW